MVCTISEGLKPSLYSIRFCSTLCPSIRVSIFIGIIKLSPFFPFECNAIYLRFLSIFIRINTQSLTSIYLFFTPSFVLQQLLSSSHPDIFHFQMSFQAVRLQFSHLRYASNYLPHLLSPENSYFRTKLPGGL